MCIGWAVGGVLFGVCLTLGLLGWGLSTLSAKDWQAILAEHDEEDI